MRLTIWMIALLAAGLTRDGQGDVQGEAVRFATFNVSFYDAAPGKIIERLRSGSDRQAGAVAEIIQRVRPSVILLNEFDYDAAAEGVALLQELYLGVGQNRSRSLSGPAEPIEFRYRYLAPCNTGIHSGHDLDRNGKIELTPGSVEYAGDCWGFGRYSGQYGMVLLSQFPIAVERVRTFQKFLWKDMPGARLPDDLATEADDDWYSLDALDDFRLSSKSHWDVPIELPAGVVHLLCSHPTPPVFDGPEDRNGRRNHDEIRFWLDYITPGAGAYIYDDKGVRGNLPAGARFVIMGDLNGDPHDGAGAEGIGALLASPLVLSNPAPESDGGLQQAQAQGGVNAIHRGNPRHDTLDAEDRDGPGNLRLDYVLPCRGTRLVASGVFWPKNTDSLFRLVGTYPFPSSDHRLVWIDAVWQERGK